MEGKDLRRMDRAGTPDTYCEVTIGSQIFRTQTVWNSNDPIFDESFAAYDDLLC